MKHGIAFAGNLLADNVKKIDVWPEQGMLCNIRKIAPGIGGLVPNTCGSLALVDPSVPLYAVGLTGNDENGRFIRQRLTSLGIDVSGIRVLEGGTTSFTDVMTVAGTGERTFFHSRGTNALFGPEHIDLDRMTADILHLGYAMLLDRFDADDPEYGTVMARVLHDAQARGIRTSMDVVSDASGRFDRVVTPSLRYCNYIILNEVEASLVTHIPVRRADDSLDEDAVGRICGKMLDLGVQESVTIHAPEGGWCMTADRVLHSARSLRLPEDFIKGKVGAGDAFCAGMLYGIYQEWTPEKSLRFGCCTAAACMSAPDSLSGVRSAAECWALEEKFGHRQA